MNSHESDEATGSVSAEESLIVRRDFDAPPERVWVAWTDPAEVDRWWGPSGFSTETDEMDVRPDGIWRFVMTGPEGEEYPNRVTYAEVEQPHRLAYSHGEPGDPEQFRVVVTFEDDGDGRTELTMRMAFESAEERERMEEFGAVEGANQTLDRLAEHLDADRNPQS